MTITSSNAWAALDVHCNEFKNKHLKDLFAEDAQRVESLTLTFGDMHYDFSKQRVNTKTIGLLAELAADVGEDDEIGIELREVERQLHTASRRLTKATLRCGF